MKKIIVFSLLALSMLIPNVEAHQEVPIRPPEAQIASPRTLIAKYADMYNVSEKLLNGVIKCESNYNPKAIHYNDGGKGKHSVGIMQFQKSTFLTWEKRFGEDLDYYSYHDQIKLGAYMISKGQGNQWTCYRHLT
jgi:soluble lytic murein transglycosylase-like protein